MTRPVRSRVAALTAALFFCLSTLAFAAATADEHYKNGYNLFKQKKFAEAVAELSQSTGMSGNDYNFFILLANAAMQAKEFDKVIEPAKKAASIDATKKDPYVLLGSAYLKKEDYPNAAKAFTEVIKDKPNDFQMNYFLGYAYFKSENFAQAVDPLEKANSVKAGDFNTLFTLGAAYAKLGKCDKAEPLLKQAATAQPKQAESINTMVMACYSSSGDAGKAVEAAKKKLEANPNDKATLQFLAQSSMVAKKWDDAKTYYEKLSSLDPKNGDYLYALGQIKLAGNDNKGAIDLYTKAIALGNKCEWHTGLGALYQTQAVEIDNAINEKLQADQDAKPDQAKLDEMMDGYNKATDEFNKAIKACKSEDAKKGLATIHERVAAWKKFADDAAKIERGESTGEEGTSSTSGTKTP